MPWDLGHLKIDRKTSGDMMEASYHNYIMQTLEKYINSLIDAYTMFEMASKQKITGIRTEVIDPETEEPTEIYVNKLNLNHFTVTENKDFITIQNGENEELWTSESLGITDFVGALNAMKLDYDKQIEEITQNEEVTEALKNNILESLSRDLQEAIEALFINLVLNTEFEFDLELFVPLITYLNLDKYTAKDIEELIVREGNVGTCQLWMGDVEAYFNGVWDATAKEFKDANNPTKQFIIGSALANIAGYKDEHPGWIDPSGKKEWANG